MYFLQIQHKVLYMNHLAYDTHIITSKLKIIRIKKREYRDGIKSR